MWDTNHKTKYLKHTQSNGRDMLRLGGSNLTFVEHRLESQNHIGKGEEGIAKTKKFLSKNYNQEYYMRLYNLLQGNGIIDEYTKEFDRLTTPRD